MLQVELQVDGSLYDAWPGPRIIKGTKNHGILDVVLFNN
jgi:hypothetical protein